MTDKENKPLAEQDINGQEPEQDTVIRKFGPTNAALKNKNTIYLLTVALAIFGLVTYFNMSKELQPEVVFPYIMVQTVYPGNPPVDMENLITRPLETEIQTVKGIKKMSSNSSQDFSLIFIEFNPNVEIKQALQDVKDAVDRAENELPDDPNVDPQVIELDVTEFPIQNINLFGDYSTEELRGFAEYLEDEIEGFPEVSKVEIQGLPDREIKIHLDKYKMESKQISFWDVNSAIQQENMSMSGGEIRMGDIRRTVRVIGEFENMDQIRNVIVKHEKGNIVYLKDIAMVEDGYAEASSYSRLDGKNVVTLQVVKKSGENLLNATDKIDDLLKKSYEDHILPKNLQYQITNDQSEFIRMQLDSLWNSIFIGMILVIIVLYFFLGLRNALFVGLAIPMSMFISFVIIGAQGITLNMIILFALILALGMLVDNAIVVVENIYRFIDRGYSKRQAAQQAVGEIAWPIITSTLTTLAAFFPLIFWDSIIGEFMGWLPITLIIVLTSSLFVALIIIPVFSSNFIKKERHTTLQSMRGFLKTIIILGSLAAIFYLGHYSSPAEERGLVLISIANLLVIAIGIVLLNRYVLHHAAEWFKNQFLDWLEGKYEKILRLALCGKMPGLFLIGTFVLLIGTIIFYFGIRQPHVILFPENEPRYINLIAEAPIGTDIEKTDSLMHEMEMDMRAIIGDRIDKVESILTNVGDGAKGENEAFGGGAGSTPNKGMITITFIDYEDRGDFSTSAFRKELSDSILGRYPGVQVEIEKNNMGPPTGYPVNIEIYGQEFDKLLWLSDTIQYLIKQAKIEGIEGLKQDLDAGKPELIVKIDRDKARRFGVSTQSISNTIRTALFGLEISDFKESEDEYPIMLRLKDEHRYNLSTLLNQKITFRSPSTGRIMQVPISAVADIYPSTTYASVNRVDMDRVITVYSNVIEGYNPTEINNKIKKTLDGFEFPDGYGYRFTGEQQDQAESMQFLGWAMLIALSLIALILVTQFNSGAKPLIIVASILFSTIGVFGGIGTFDMDFVIIMTGVGIISLAGVVVNNAIVLIDYIDLQKNRRKKELGIDEEDNLTLNEARECIVSGGKTRLRPVLLTAITTILGLLPMALGMNINFNTLASEFDPEIYFGGDMAMFWGPMSSTVIFGLTFATFLTLVIVPVMYLLLNQVKLWAIKRRGA